MKTVVVSGARSLPALKIVRALASSGKRVIATDSLFTTTAGISNACSRYVRMAAPKIEMHQFLEDVAKLIREEQPDLWIPTSEEVFYLAKGRKTHFPELPLFAPSFAQLATFHDKARFNPFAKKLGWGTQETIFLADTKDVESLLSRSEEFVFKPAWSRGGERVLIQPSFDKLRTIRPTPLDPWIAQSYLPGEEISVYAIACRGQLVSHVAYHPRHRVGCGAAIAFKPVDDADAREFTAAFVEATQWHGQVGFDLCRDKNGRLLPIECNPRATSGIHLMNQANLIDALSGQCAEPESESRMSIIGLAMLTYGLPSAATSGSLPSLLKDYLKGRDVLWDWRDPAPFFQQFLFLGEVWQLARRRNISMHSAFTNDFEWDGESM